MQHTTKLLFAFILSNLFLSVSGQTPLKRFYLEGYARPLMYRLNSPIEEKGEGFNQVKFVRQNSPEIGLNLGVRAYKGLSFGIGVSLKELKQRVEWHTREVLNPDNLRTETHSFGYGIWVYGLKLNTRYNFRSFYVEAAFEATDMINKKSPFYLDKNLREIAADGISTEQYGYAKAMTDGVYVIPELSLGMELVDGLFVHIGVKAKWWKYKYSPNIQIFYETPTSSNPQNPHRILTDAYVNDQYIMGFAGLSYQFQYNLWKKKGKK